MSTSSPSPSPYQPLVRDGHAREPNRQPSMFISSTVPVVDENTIILGATHPTLSTADPQEDGWFISDFYAFNYLFKGLGMQQTWLTAVEPARLVEKYGPFLLGNPYEERKICLSQELLDSDELSPVTVVSPERTIDRFLIEAKKASELAKRTSAPLLLLTFCHGLPNFRYLLNNADKQRGLGMARLKDVLELGVRVTLVTTACHSGGWATSPDFNHTTMAASDETTTKHGTSNAWGVCQNYVVGLIGLPTPSKRICILWDESAWEAALTETDPTWKQRYKIITRALGDFPILLPNDKQGPPFFRPNCYLVAALVEANKPDDETMAIISAIEPVLETLKDFHEQRACQDERVPWP